MKIKEILFEKAVESSWIVSLTHNRPNKRLTMSLSSGKVYSILNITRTTFEKWTRCESKGKYFHTFIKNRFPIIRII